MTLPLLAALMLWFGQVFFASSFRTYLAPNPKETLQDHMRGKDEIPEPSMLGKRAARAQNNYLESLVVFLPLALLHEIQGTTHGLAVQGAWLFVVARAVYVPAYLVAVFGLRTTVWTAAFVGLGMMVYPLL